MLLGYATPEETAAFATAHPKLSYRPLSDTGLLVSQAGFGAYRVDVGSDTHQAALEMALRGGINLIDTSSNYSDGRSEELIGQVLGRLVEAEELKRAQVVTVSKVGYLQGQNFVLSQERKAEGNSFPDLVEYSQGLEHCIHPEFIEDQLTRSLARLQIDRLDVYLLHNPEYYLGWAKRQEMPLAEARKEYERRIAAAFRHLEQEVEYGRISYYGISSNSFPKPRDAYDFTSLERVWEIAQEISAENHFRAIQLPMNLLETEAASLPNQTVGQSVLQFAHEKNLGVLINRPLNAVVGNSLLRLAKIAVGPQSEEGMDEAQVEEAIEELLKEEVRLQQAVFNIDIPFRTKQEFVATLTTGKLLKERWKSFFTLSNWYDVYNGYLQPRTQSGLTFLVRRPELPPEVNSWVHEYTAAFKKATELVSSFYRAEANARNEVILANAAAADPDWQAPQLSQTAVRGLRTTQGVTSVLVGMRRPEYVADVLEELSADIPQKERTQAWELMSEAIE